MSESTQAPGGPPETGLPPGEALRRERERRGLQMADVANHLKVAPAKVEAIEAGDWQKLLPLPYLRGFVRNYAKLVQVDAIPLLARIDVALGRTQADTMQSLQPAHDLNTPFFDHTVRRGVLLRLGKRTWASLAVSLVIVLIFALSYWFQVKDVSEENAVAPEPPIPAMPVPESAPPADGRIEQPLPVPGATPAPGTSMNTPQAVPPPVEAVRPAPAVALAPADAPAANARAGSDVASAGAALVLRFADQSWVEVRQTDGKVLYSQLGRAGNEQILRGRGPYELVIGNPAAVTLLHAGVPVDLAPHTRQNVARLRLP